MAAPLRRRRRRDAWHRRGRLSPAKAGSANRRAPPPSLPGRVVRRRRFAAGGACRRQPRTGRHLSDSFGWRAPDCRRCTTPPSPATRPPRCASPTSSIRLGPPASAPSSSASSWPPPTTRPIRPWSRPTVYRSVIRFARAHADLVVVDTQIVEAFDTSGLIDHLVIPLLVEEPGGSASPTSPPPASTTWCAA